eukprot:CAMPEP_0172825214 /NCGR_PEP_ID=MMETSP1075-20121228/18516_1 /TAXON_ID=2916 /ORGANISM="Ceratium fusus, Strain PA161109" /LENGTH=34 /DNA_ID= /DNA_START= /DNA_END= /DNA_ORIENTATION=
MLLPSWQQSDLLPCAVAQGNMPAREGSASGSIDC